MHKGQKQSQPCTTQGTVMALACPQPGYPTGRSLFPTSQVGRGMLPGGLGQHLGKSPRNVAVRCTSFALAAFPLPAFMLAQEESLSLSLHHGILVGHTLGSS